MATVTDAYGRAITITLDQGGMDVYTLAGVSLSVPTGTPQAQAVASIESMAPAGYAPPKVNYSFLEFMALFTPAEQAAIVGSSDPQVKLFTLMAAGVGTVQLSNPEVVAGVNYLATPATATPPGPGLIAPARVAAILAGQAP